MNGIFLLYKLFIQLSAMALFVCVLLVVVVARGTRTPSSAQREEAQEKNQE
jgi:hypothetical protein